MKTRVSSCRPRQSMPQSRSKRSSWAKTCATTYRTSPGGPNRTLPHVSPRSCLRVYTNISRPDKMSATATIPRPTLHPTPTCYSGSAMPILDRLPATTLVPQYELTTRPPNLAGLTSQDVSVSWRTARVTRPTCPLPGYRAPHLRTGRPHDAFLPAHSATYNKYIGDSRWPAVTIVFAVRSSVLLGFVSWRCPAGAARLRPPSPTTYGECDRSSKPRPEPVKDRDARIRRIPNVLAT